MQQSLMPGQHKNKVVFALAKPVAIDDMLVSQYSRIRFQRNHLRAHYLLARARFGEMICVCV